MCDWLLIYWRWTIDVCLYLRMVNVLMASGSCETIDQSASRLIDDVMTSTNEISWAEIEVTCDLSLRTFWCQSQLQWNRLQRSRWIQFWQLDETIVSDGEEKSRAEPGLKWSCRQSDERYLNLTSEKDSTVWSRWSFMLRIVNRWWSLDT